MSGRNLRKRTSSYLGSQPGNPRYRRRRTGGGSKGGKSSSHAALSIPRKRYPTSLVWRGSGLLPQKLFTTPKYEYWWTATSGTGFYDWVIRGNSLYDPDVALGGESVGGFDTIMTVYNRYKVHGSAIRVRAVNNDTDDPVDITIFPSKVSGAYAQANANAVRGYPLAKFIVVSNQHGHGEINHYAKTGDVMGHKDIDDEGFVGDGSHDPTHMWYWHVCIHNHTADHALNLQLWLEVDFKAEFSDFYPWTQ